ncbi:MAG: branched-chain amino acid ABC transporter permease [Candidatus Hodarchaeota archaeon]
MAESEGTPPKRSLKEYLNYLTWWQWLLAVVIVFLALWVPEPPIWERSPDYLMQIIVDAIFAGSTYVLLAIGLTLVYRILKFANFAHAEFVTFGAYMAFLAFVVAQSIGLGIGEDILWGALIAFLLTGLLGVASDKLVFGQLREREASAMTIMISSIGVGLIIRHLIQEVWTGASVFYDPVLPEWLTDKHGWPSSVQDWIKNPRVPIIPVHSGTYDFLLFNIVVRFPGEGLLAYDINLFPFLEDIFLLEILNLSITITPMKMLVILCSCILVLACHLLFTRTKLGKAMRATSDNPDLAQAAGIDVNRVIVLVWFIGAGLAGVGGVLSIVAVRRINPDTGFKLLLVAFAVVILGGIGSFYGAILAAYIMGFAENYGILFINGLGAKYRKFFSFLDGEKWEDFLIIDDPFHLGLNLNWHLHIKLPFSILQFNLADTLPLSFDFGYKPAISFAILIVTLLFRPRGLMGLPEEAGKEE